MLKKLLVLVLTFSLFGGVIMAQDAEPAGSEGVDQAPATDAPAKEAKKGKKKGKKKSKKKHHKKKRKAKKAKAASEASAEEGN